MGMLRLRIKGALRQRNVRRSICFCVVKPRAADHCVALVNGLRDVKIELLACRDANVKTVAFNRSQNLLRVGSQNTFRPLQ